MKKIILLALTAFSLTMSAQNKKFTLDDLIPGGKNYMNLRTENRNYIFEGDKAIEASPKEEPEALPSASITDHNLFIHTAEGKDIQITHDGSADIVYGQSVHRDEYGCSEGIFWSSDKSLLAFYRMDQSMVSHYPQVNITPFEDSQCYTAKKPEDVNTRCAALEPDAYPMAGETSHKVTVGIYNISTGKTLYLDAGDPTDRYFTNISWNPDCKRIYMIELNRDVTDLKLNEYDATTGKFIRTLLTEHNDKYVEPTHPIKFLPWDASKFVYQTRADGYNHLYLYNLPQSGNATLQTQLTRGEFEVISVVGYSKATKSIIYTSNESHALNQSVYKVDMKGKRTLLGEAEGWHGNIRLSDSGKYLIDNYSTPTVPRAIDLVNVSNGKNERLFTATDKWVEHGYNIPEVKVGTIKAADGVTDLYYRLILPVGFDPNKKYPTIIYVYGGPHAHMIDARFNYSSRGWDTYMAQEGYVMFTLDNRGSEHRGLAFEQATFRRLGEVELQDQMCGVNFLKSLPYVDTDRMGIHGWSFGGYMTTNMMTSFADEADPKRGIIKGECPFKVGVAGGPVIDWKFYEIMYGERYMDTPQTNPEGYEARTLLNKAQNLKGRLQIIYGLNDPVCVPQHTLSFVRACINAGTYPDLFTYPGDGHNMFGSDRPHLHEVITRYFKDHLSPLTPVIDLSLSEKERGSHPVK